MSTLKVSEIRNASSATGGLSIAADGVVSGALPSPNRNLLINGAMQVAQRGTSKTGINGDGYYAADRWRLNPSSLGTWTQTVENDAPTGTGLRKSSKILCTTASASPSAGAVGYFHQLIEGQNLQRVKKGTASAEQLTMSFWVKSNITGTYAVLILDRDNIRSVSANYTISASATWERKTVTFPADTTGALDNDNASSFEVYFSFGAGTDYTSGTLNTTWASYTPSNTLVGQVNVAAATNNYWQITGVQLEVGDTATEFEFKSYGQELAECQRYYFRIPNSNSAMRFGLGECRSTTTVEAYIYMPVAMRATPTSIDTSATASHYGIFSAGSVTACNVVPTLAAESSPSVAVLSAGVASGLTAGRAAQLFANSTTSAYLGIGAEL